MIQYITDNFIMITTLVAACRWLYEYVQNRKFTQNKFLLERIEKFYELDSVKKVNRMLDWNAIKIEINGNLTTINDSILYEALFTHNKKSKFDPVEVAIRSLFDEYFDEMRELIILSECGLVDKRNLRKFLKYWIEILNGQKKNKPQSLVKVIDEYLTFYDYHDVRDFINKKQSSLIFKDIL